MQLKRHFRAGRRPREAVMTFLEGESHRLGVGETRRAWFSTPGSIQGSGYVRDKWNQSLAMPVMSEGWKTLGCLPGVPCRHCLYLQFPSWNLGSTVGSKENLY